MLTSTVYMIKMASESQPEIIYT